MKGKKLQNDLVWNLFSFGILGSSGILINILIARFFTPEDLGVFNQVFAFYILGSQFAAFGIQYSALKCASEATSSTELGNIALASSLGVLCFAIPSSLIFYYSGDILGQLLNSRGVAVGLLYVAPAIGLFALNKVIISIVNGARHMRAFALFQAYRYLCLFGFVAVATWQSWPGTILSMAFFVAELSLFIMMSIYILTNFGVNIGSDLVSNIKKHIHFGGKGFMGGAVTELNSRIDILMLGVFLNDIQVGIYSMAAMIAEGLAQLTVVIRNNINPIIALQYRKKNFDSLTKFLNKTTAYTYIMMFPIVAIAILVYPYTLELFLGGELYDDSWTAFNVLCLGVFLASGYFPLDMILIQTGYPGMQTVLRILTLISNILLNFALIPSFGILGAAIATSCSFILSTVYLKFLARNKLSLKV